MKLSGVIAIDKSDVDAKGQGHRGKSKFSDRNSSLNLQMAMKWCPKLEVA